MSEKGKRPECVGWYHVWTLVRTGWKPQTREVCKRCGVERPLAQPKETP